MTGEKGPLETRLILSAQTKEGNLVPTRGEYNRHGTNVKR